MRYDVNITDNLSNTDLGAFPSAFSHESLHYV